MANYLSDFNQANGPVGSDITILSGSWDIDNNSLRLAASQVGIAVRSETLTRDNYVVNGDINPNGAGSGARIGLAARVQNTSNYYYAVVKFGAFGGVYLYSYKATTSQLLAQSAGAGSTNIPNNVPINLEFGIAGTNDAQISIKLNGATVITHTDSNNPIVTPGRAGFIVSTTDAVPKLFDNLSVVEGQAAPVISIDQSSQTVMLDYQALTYPATFSATATDEEDGNLTAAIVWERRLDGGAWTSAGTGASVSINLSTGVNEIRASVTDSGTATSTDSVIYTVNPYDFGGTTPVANGFILGVNGTHTPDSFASVGGVKPMLIEQRRGRVFISEDGSFIAYIDTGETSMEFDYRIQDQDGVSNKATITINA